MVEKLRMYIGGQWCESEGGQLRPLVSPVTGQVIAEVPEGTVADVEKAISAAYAGKDALCEMSVFERAELCHRVADVLERDKDVLARGLSLEQGKVYRTEAVGEILTAVAMFRVKAEEIKRLFGQVMPSMDINKRILTQRVPRGVYALLVPWNFPVALAAEYLAAGLASGNAIIWKPSSYTPRISVRVLERIIEAGAPPGSVNLVMGAGSTVGKTMVSSPEIQGIALTGSAETGEAVAREAGIKSLILELGGNGPTVILEDANLVRAAQKVAVGCFACAGQICSSTERILVHKDVHDEFVRYLMGQAKAVQLGNPMDMATSMGPLNNEETALKVEHHIEDAIGKGGRLLVGGHRAKGFPTDLYFPATIVDDVPPDSLLNREETFGPVAPILTFSHDDEALKLANDNDYGLIGSVFTRSLRRAFYFAEELQNGNVNINETSAYWETHTAAGGYSGKRSGIRRYGGQYTLLEMTQVKTIVLGIDTEE